MTGDSISFTEVKLIGSLHLPMLNFNITHSQNSLHCHLHHQNESQGKAHSLSK